MSASERPLQRDGLRIFISSTTEDLKDHRAAAVSMLRKLGHRVDALENLSGAAQLSPFDLSFALIRECQLFIGILAWRYGYIPSEGNPEGFSFTELEYRHARELGLPTLMFVADKEAPWPPRFIDTGQPLERLERFKSEVLNRVVVGFFSSPDNLAQLVAAAVTNFQASSVAQFSTARPAFPVNVDPFELAWRLVVDFKADPALLRHMDLDQLGEAVEKWKGDSNAAADLDPSSAHDAALDQLRKKQPGLAPNALWLAWMRATRASLQPPSEPPQSVA